MNTEYWDKRDRRRAEVSATNAKNAERSKAKATHTPGPWMIVPGSYTVGVPGYVFFKGSADEINSVKEVAVVRKASSVGGDVVNNLTAEETQANAHLIAAAPELLEALVSVLEIANRYAAKGGTLGGRYNDDEMNKARAAIAKATTN